MNRRDLLKFMGLGGLTLTLPTSARAILPRISFLPDPPLHVLNCQIHRLDGVAASTFRIFGDARIERQQLWGWSLFIAIRKTPQSSSPLLEGMPLKDCVKENGSGSLTSFIQGASLNFSGDDILDLWLVPGQENPRPLPSFRTILYDWNPLQPKRRTRLKVRKFSKIQLDRDRAVELGLVSPNAAFEQA